MQEFGRCFARQIEDNRNAPLTKDVDLSAAELGVAGADGDQGLDWVVGNGGYAGVDAISCILVPHGQTCMKKHLGGCNKPHLGQKG